MTDTREVPVTHELKCWPEFYEPICSGKKTFEIRMNDRDFKVGDILVLREFNLYNQTYSGRQVTRIVSYLTDFKQDGRQVVMGLAAPTAPVVDDIERTIERCAKQCMIVKAAYPGETLEQCAVRGMANECAEAIRALSRQPAQADAEPVLTAPLKIGSTGFSRGVKISTVQLCIDAKIAHTAAQPKDALRSALEDAWKLLDAVKSSSGGDICRDVDGVNWYVARDAARGGSDGK